jgi:hypothetical protein
VTYSLLMGVACVFLSVARSIGLLLLTDTTKSTRWTCASHRRGLPTSFQTLVLAHVTRILLSAPRFRLHRRTINKKETRIVRSSSSSWAWVPRTQILGWGGLESDINGVSFLIAKKSPSPHADNISQCYVSLIFGYIEETFCPGF